MSYWSKVNCNLTVEKLAPNNESISEAYLRYLLGNVMLAEDILFLIKYKGLDFVDTVYEQHIGNMIMGSEGTLNYHIDRSPCGQTTNISIFGNLRDTEEEEVRRYLNRIITEISNLGYAVDGIAKINCEQDTAYELLSMQFDKQ